MKLYIDCDGVLTDGRLTIDHKGEKLFKTFHTRDVRAIRELIANGWEVTIVSADDWGGTAKFAEKVGADLLTMRNKGELETPYFAIGDDAWDVPMLAKAVHAFCPVNADPSVLRIRRMHVLRTPGGCGVIAELCRVLLAEDESTKGRKYA